MGEKRANPAVRRMRKTWLPTTPVGYEGTTTEGRCKRSGFFKEKDGKSREARGTLKRASPFRIGKGSVV